MVDGHEAVAEGLDVLVDLVRDLLVQPDHETCARQGSEGVYMVYMAHPSIAFSMHRC